VILGLLDVDLDSAIFHIHRENVDNPFVSTVPFSSGPDRTYMAAGQDGHDRPTCD
jgi:hypothetical protein